MRKHLLKFISESDSHSVRGLRILLEYFYALQIFEPLHDANLHVVSVFGSARTKPSAKEYQNAVKLGEGLYNSGFAVVTGASQGIMEAANKGVSVAIVKDLQKASKFKHKTSTQIENSKEFKKILGHYSLGLKISLPFESESNPYLGVEAIFHYFMVRKFFFAALSSAFIACEGGWGTRDELFEVMTLVQTGKMPLMPIVYIASKPAHLIGDLNFSVKNGYISKEDLNLIQIVPDYKKAVIIIKKFYSLVKNIKYTKDSRIIVKLQHPLTVKQKTKVTNLVTKKYKNVYTGGVKFNKTSMTFYKCIHKSYGILRHIIDSIS